MIKSKIQIKKRINIYLKIIERIDSKFFPKKYPTIINNPIHQITHGILYLINCEYFNFKIQAVNGVIREIGHQNLPKNTAYHQYF